MRILSNSMKSAAVYAGLIFVGGLSAHAQITIETVTVGNAGNAADTSGYGAVAYTYDIGKYEVTNTQYAAFLNAVAATETYYLYNSNMSGVLGGITRTGSSGSYTYATKSGYENKPVNYVSFWSATRFANWLNNGQGSGSTETGSYTLTSGGILDNTLTRNVGANWVVASENEWYKVAYYDPTKGGYWLHATQSDALGQNNPFTDANGANYNDGDYANGGFSGPGTTDVGAYANAGSYYGTFDQGGNVWEWNDSIIGSNRGLRGGSLFNNENALRSSDRGEVLPYNETPDWGFRVVSLAPIPEPSTYVAVMGGVSIAVAFMRRRRTLRVTELK